MRLIGIDTPETERPETPVECGGPQASAHMSSLLAPGARVRLVADPTQDRVDRYGRLLRYVIHDGRDVGLAQLRAGWAEVYVYEGVPFARVARYRAAADAAQSGDRGAWALCHGDFHTAELHAGHRAAPSTASTASSAPATIPAVGDKDCSDFQTHRQAQQFFTSHGGSASNDYDRLDEDHDGQACESLP